MSAASKTDTSQAPPPGQNPLATDVYRLQNVQGTTLLDRNWGEEPNQAMGWRSLVDERLSQSWRIVPDPGLAGNVFIESVCDDWRLTQNGSRQPCVLAYPRDADPRQSWTPQAKAAAGVFSFVSAQDPTLSLDLAGGLAVNGTRVVAFPTNAGPNQSWTMQAVAANTGSLSSADAALITKTRFPDSACRYYFRTSTLGTVTPAQVHAQWAGSELNQANEPHVGYVSETFDCDDYAVNMAAIMAEWWFDHRPAGVDHACAFGQMWTANSVDPSAGHAFNFFFDDLWRLYMMEPQTGQSFTMLEMGNSVDFVDV